MDRKTKEELQKIGQQIPRDLLAKGVIKEKRFAIDKEIALDLLGKPGIGDKQRDLIRRGLEDPRVRATHEKVSTRIDEKVSQEIDKFVETKMQQAIKSGKIKKAKRDSFHNMVDAHMKRK